MFDDNSGRRFELGNQTQGRVGIVEIIVTQFLALNLPRPRDPKGGRTRAVESRPLVRVLTVTETLTQAPGKGQPLRRIFSRGVGHPVGDFPVVGRGPGEGGCSQTDSQDRARGAAVGIHFGHHDGKIGAIDDHGNETMVFRRGADERRPADIDILDTFGKIRARRDRRLEGV